MNSGIASFSQSLTSERRHREQGLASSHFVLIRLQREHETRSRFFCAILRALRRLRVLTDGSGESKFIRRTQKECTIKIFFLGSWKHTTVANHRI